MPSETVAASTPRTVGTEHPITYARNETSPLKLNRPWTRLMSSLDATETIPHPVRNANRQPDRI